MPTDAVIEDAWGIRFVTVRVLASSGLIDVRYQILDPSKADRLHSKGTENLPKLHVPGGSTVLPQSAMFHFHTTANPDAVARGFDILYGNQRGALRAGTTVDIVLADGMKLKNVPVTD